MLGHAPPRGHRSVFLLLLVQATYTGVPVGHALDFASSDASDIEMTLAMNAHRSLADDESGDGGGGGDGVAAPEVHWLPVEKFFIKFSFWGLLGMMYVFGAGVFSLLLALQIVFMIFSINCVQKFRELFPCFENYLRWLVWTLFMATIKLCFWGMVYLLSCLKSNSAKAKMCHTPGEANLGRKPPCVDFCTFKDTHKLKKRILKGGGYAAGICAAAALLIVLVFCGVVFSIAALIATMLVLVIVNFQQLSVRFASYTNGKIAEKFGNDTLSDKFAKGAETVATAKEASGEITGSLVIIFLSFVLSVIRFFYNVSLVGTTFAIVGVEVEIPVFGVEMPNFPAIKLFEFLLPVLDIISFKWLFAGIQCHCFRMFIGSAMLPMAVLVLYVVFAMRADDEFIQLRLQTQLSKTMFGQRIWVCKIQDLVTQGSQKFCHYLVQICILMGVRTLTYMVGSATWQYQDEMCPVQDQFIYYVVPFTDPPQFQIGDTAYRERVGRAFAFIPLAVICIVMYKVCLVLLGGECRRTDLKGAGPCKMLAAVRELIMKKEIPFKVECIPVSLGFWPKFTQDKYDIETRTVTRVAGLGQTGNTPSNKVDELDDSHAYGMQRSSTALLEKLVMASGNQPKSPRSPPSKNELLMMNQRVKALHRDAANEIMMATTRQNMLTWQMFPLFGICLSKANEYLNQAIIFTFDKDESGERKKFYSWMMLESDPPGFPYKKAVRVLRAINSYWQFCAIFVAVSGKLTFVTIFSAAVGVDLFVIILTTLSDWSTGLLNKLGCKSCVKSAHEKSKALAASASDHIDGLHAKAAEAGTWAEEKAAELKPSEEEGEAAEGDAAEGDAAEGEEEEGEEEEEEEWKDEMLTLDFTFEEEGAIGVALDWGKREVLLGSVEAAVSDGAAGAAMGAVEAMVQEGMLVTGVTDGELAAGKGVKVGDRVLALNGTSVRKGPKSLEKVKAQLESAVRPIVLRIQREPGEGAEEGEGVVVEKEQADLEQAARVLAAQAGTALATTTSPEAASHEAVVSVAPEVHAEEAPAPPEPIGFMAAVLLAMQGVLPPPMVCCAPPTIAQAGAETSHDVDVLAVQNHEALVLDEDENPTPQALPASQI